MKRAKAIEALKKAAKLKDHERAHLDADDALLSILIELGYADVVAAWKKVPKWYS